MSVVGPAGAKTRLRLAYLTGQYPRATDTFIQREVAALRALGHHVQTFSVRRPPEMENVGPETVAERKNTFYLLPLRGLFAAHLFQLFFAPGRYISALRLAWKHSAPGFGGIARQVAYFAEAAVLAQQMRKQALMHLHNHFADSSCSVAAIAAEMGGFTFSFTMHGPGEFFETNRWWIGEKVRRALFVNCISYFCRSQAMVFAPLDCWGKLRVVHCGVDPSSFSVKHHRGRGSRLLFVGRLSSAKGLPVLLQALAQVEGATLLIAGDGPDRKVLEEYARECGVSSRVTFLGYLAQQRIRDLLGEADAFVMASFAEGIPVVLMEAMAAGIPVVATRIAGIPELVYNEQNGLLVSPGDTDATAHAVQRLLGDPDLRNRLAIIGRATIERDYDIQSESRWLVTILTSALAGKNEGVRPQTRIVQPELSFD